MVDGGMANERQSELASRRRLGDLLSMVRGWADRGDVDPRVAARFVRVRRDAETSRRIAWLAGGEERRRRDERPPGIG